jgi:hypothetical protein
MFLPPPPPRSVVAVNKTTYEIKYFNINQEDEEEDEE